MSEDTSVTNNRPRITNKTALLIEPLIPLHEHDTGLSDANTEIDGLTVIVVGRKLVMKSVEDE